MLLIAFLLILVHLGSLLLVRPLEPAQNSNPMQTQNVVTISNFAAPLSSTSQPPQQGRPSDDDDGKLLLGPETTQQVEVINNRSDIEPLRGIEETDHFINYVVSEARNIDFHTFSRILEKCLKHWKTVNKQTSYIIKQIELSYFVQLKNQTRLHISWTSDHIRIWFTKSLENLANYLKENLQTAFPEMLLNLIMVPHFLRSKSLAKVNPIWT